MSIETLAHTAKALDKNRQALFDNYEEFGADEDSNRHDRRRIVLISSAHPPSARSLGQQFAQPKSARRLRCP